MNSYRTHTCGELRSSDVNKEVKLAGWIHRKRNLGNLCFVDLRDHYGITQCVFDSSSDLFEKIEAIRPESVIGISGKVMMRESINKNIPTGDIEIKVDALEDPGAFRRRPFYLLKRKHTLHLFPGLSPLGSAVSGRGGRRCAGRNAP